MLVRNRCKPRQPLRCQIANEPGRRERRISVRLTKGTQLGEHLGRIEVERPGQKAVGVRKIERPDQRLVTRDKRLRKVLVHGAPLRAHAPFEMPL